MEDPVEEYSDCDGRDPDGADTGLEMAPTSEAKMVLTQELSDMLGGDFKASGAHESGQRLPRQPGAVFDDGVPGFEDTFPASPETVLAAVRRNGDGTMAEDGLDMHRSMFDEDLSTQVDATGGLEAQGGGPQRAPGPPSAAAGPDGVAHAPTEAARAAADDAALEDSDVDEALDEVPLPDEPWMSLPPRERELWEKVRPRALRREAAQLRALRLPNAVMNRLMRLHPHLPMKSTEAVDLINYATVLMMQAVVKAAVREKGSGRVRVQFGDIRKACVGVRELQFLHPLENTLDASAVVMRPAQLEFPRDDAEGGGGPTTSSGAAKGAKKAAVPLGAGQRMLSLGAFASATTPLPEVEPADAEGAAGEEGSESGGEVTPIPEERPAVLGKRKAPASASKGPSKAPRRADSAAQKAPQAAAPAGIAAFFRRAEATLGA